MSREHYSEQELDQIRALQRDAYACVQEVAAGLRPGTTEREAAARVGDGLRARGVDAFFHTPFAWFGDRAAFRGFAPRSWRRPHHNVIFAPEFFPTDRRIEPGMSGILDVAPIRAGMSADIGYAFALGDNPALASAMAFLREVRALVLAEVRRGRTMREVYRAVDEAFSRAGYENAHATYPSGVIGHKIGRLPFPHARGRQIAGFDARAYLYFGQLALKKLIPPPIMNDTPLANARPAPGLWAIEPHVRRGGLGAKWEEILVVTESDAYWLDDDLPHARA